ncbi:MAG: methionine ABC transporter ATP-binding protein [Mobiluncus porci]|uniref:methionine ABC transporter ATP-binding protein n=1 Tax=Mobiluncus porci TaxID=2652278 RepID=UPI0023F366D0|nr:methionine ABC transporter ATP-binding protein [Mobiluncus porci]MDD7541105.1 methionine ABC transporter ATP-binding protein [Mobiluncus porci]MDY5747564.1 methionine ABC transporter ATP-binding protein [Mobiluncus porci]
MKPREPMITLRDVTKIYHVKSAAGGAVHALDGINLEISKGSIHGIVGQSGAGKSTLIRCLTALEQPTSGSITVDGQEMTELNETQLRQARRNIGMVFQAANLLDSRTAAGNVAYPLYLAGVPRGKRHEQVMNLLELVGLKDRASSYPSQLSGGQKQRVGIARGLATNPPVLLCDEPTSALDQETTRQVLHLIRDLRDSLGVTVIIITHEMAVVREICDSVTLLEHGKIIQSGTVEDILMQPNSRLALELVPPPRLEEAPKLNGKDAAVVDIAFNSTPGKPTGSAVMGLVASEGADVAAGTFETVGSTQVGRLALAVPRSNVAHVLAAMRSKGIAASERHLGATEAGDLLD